MENNNGVDLDPKPSYLPGCLLFLGIFALCGGVWYSLVHAAFAIYQ